MESKANAVNTQTRDLHGKRKNEGFSSKCSLTKNKITSFLVRYPGFVAKTNYSCFSSNLTRYGIGR
jgi:hypothetical protein